MQKPFALDLSAFPQMQPLLAEGRGAGGWRGEKELTLLIYLGQDLAFSGIEMSPSARVKSHYNFALSKM